MKKITLYSLLLLGLAAGSCKKFLDVTPKKKVLPVTVADYEMFLNDLLLADAGYMQAEFMTDDIHYTDEQIRSMANSRSTKNYLWQKETMLQTDEDNEWVRIYSNIYYCNLVLDKIVSAPGDAGARERNIAEAKIQRAYYYFHLANIFGKEYTAGSSASDLAVPLLLAPDLEAKTKRATVKEVYEQVIKDLSDAIANPALPDTGRNYVHPGKMAANALLARVRLYMGDYAGAKAAAEKALAVKSTLLDHNTFAFVNPARPTSGVTNKPIPENNPENLFTKTNSNNGVFTRFMINPELLGIIGEKDLRYMYTFTRIPRSAVTPVSPYPDYFPTATNFSIGVPEMMLIRAEAFARDNKKDDAVAILNSLRQKRFKPEDYTALTAATPDEALALVLRERRLELMYRGLRLFDLKRLNNDPRFKKDLQRDHLGQVYRLPAGSPNYLLEIAPKIMMINPDILPNPRN